MLVKYGFLKKQKTQRYRCKKCLKCCSDAEKRTFGTLRSKPEKIIMVVNLLTEGVGVRAAGRLAGCHRDTVLRILRHAGTRSYELLKKKLDGVKVNRIEADEVWTKVYRSAEKDTNPESDMNGWGDFYIFLGIEATSKLLMMPTIGKRSERHTEMFANDLAKCTDGRFQLSTDGFKPYKEKMKAAFGDRIDFAQFYKERNMLNANKKFTGKRKALKITRAGNPNKSLVTTAHVERVNLSLRHYNKRFTRKSISFSKDEEYLAHSVYLFVASYNFCKVHKGILGKQTPAMASGLTDRVWKSQDLLSLNAL